MTDLPGARGYLAQTHRRARRRTPRFQPGAALFVLALAACASGAATPVGGPPAAQGPGLGDSAPAAPVLYQVSFERAVHHEARITVAFQGVATGRPLELLMPRASPGRYALHEFAKNVFDLSASDGAGRPLELVQLSPSEWSASGHDGTVQLAYTLYANHADGTYAGIDSTHAHFNMPAAFLYARGLEARPVRITFRPVNGWRVATQLVPTTDPYTFEADDLQYFMDSPTELSDFTLVEWRQGPGEGFHYRLALHHTGTDAEAQAYAVMARQVIAEQAAVFGEYPDFDYGSYTFLADYLPWVFGDGMEHRNSTILASSASLEQNRQGLLGTLAHEHFHAWSMERLRDADLEPFRFQEANMSSNLWFGEGFTSYYDALVRLRAGLMPLDNYLADMGRLVDLIVRSPARAYRGPADMSRMAPFTDAARSVDEPAFPNTFVSYYSWGEALGFGLDLLLRRDHGTSLDAYMRLLWERFGRHQGELRPTRPYTTADLRQVLADLTGDAAFAEDFFTRYVENGEVLDYAALAEAAGMVLRPARREAGSLGLVAGRFIPPTGGRPGGILLDGPQRPGSAAAREGLTSGDVLLAVDGASLAGPGALEAALRGKAPGSSVTLTFFQTGATKTARATLEADPTLELVTFEAAGRDPGAEARALREAWVASRAGEVAGSR